MSTVCRINSHYLSWNSRVWWNAHCHVEVSGDTDKDLWGCYVGFPLLTLPRNSEVPSTKQSVNTRDTPTRHINDWNTRRILNVQSSIPGLLQNLQLTCDLHERRNPSHKSACSYYELKELSFMFLLALRNYDTAVRCFWCQPDLNYPLPTWEVISGPRWLRASYLPGIYIRIICKVMTLW
jgi:hypothetical protein